MSTMMPSDFKRQRLVRGLSLREVSRRLGISAPYLSDLERGNRNWNEPLISNYRKILRPIQHPDPFEQWWDKGDWHGLNLAASKSAVRVGWDAAMKYKEGK